MGTRKNAPERRRHGSSGHKKKNARERRRHARGEGAPARKAPENRFPPPLQLPGSRCVICQKFLQKTTDLAQTKRAAKKRCTFYLRSKYICYKDQLSLVCLLLSRAFFLVPTTSKRLLRRLSRSLRRSVNHGANKPPDARLDIHA